MEAPELRILHTEGLTCVSYSKDGNWIVSGGPEGDVRLLKTFDDDERSFSCGSDKIYAVASDNDKVYVASEDCSVSSFTIPDGRSDGILTRFSMPVYCLATCSSHSLLAAGAADFDIRLVDLKSRSVKTLSGHAGPILSLSFDPQVDFLASASCDGSVRIWSISECKSIHSLHILGKCNDLTTAKSLCRLSWQPQNGKLLAIPVKNEVHLYSRSDWKCSICLKSGADDCEEDSQIISGVAWSADGSLIAAGTVTGVIYMWKVSSQSLVKTIKSEPSTITSLNWHQHRGELLFATMAGKIGQCLLDDFHVQETEDVDLSGMFDDDLDELGHDFASGDPSGSLFVDGEAQEGDDNEDEDVIQPRKKRARTNKMSDDENDGYNLEDDIDQRKANESVIVDVSLMEAIEADKKGVAMGTEEAKAPSAVMPPCRCPPPTVLQPPFQPGSTPEILTSCFMAYNLVGTVKRSMEEDISLIDVEFHDASLHHGIHLTNHFDHSMASLSSTALALASRADGDIPSKLQCIHFGAWDSSKEWVTTMPADESIEAIGISDSCLAVATDRQLLRTFTLAGVQIGLVSLPGPVVCLGVFDDWLLIAFHQGQGLLGEQKLGCWLLDVSKQPKLRRETHLPLSSKSTLSWLGFTVEGRPLSYDSKGILQLWNEESGWVWQPVSDMRKHLKGMSDHYWIVGVSEANMDVRCILCKGHSYPTTLPRPVITTIAITAPLCEMETEKSQLEGELLKLFLFPHGRNDKRLTSTLIKMFALACKADRDCRAFDVATMLPNEQAIGMAITYASRMKRIALAERLNEMAIEREQSDEEEEEEEVEVEETYQPSRKLPVVERKEELGSFQRIQLQRRQERISREETAEADLEKGDNEEEEEEEDEDLEDEIEKVKVEESAYKKKPKSNESASSLSKTNPFKMSQSGSASAGGVLGNIDELSAGIEKKKKPAAEKPTAGEKKPRKRESQKKKNERLGLKAWMEENKEMLEGKYPDLPDDEWFSQCSAEFLKLEEEDRGSWIQKGKDLDAREKKGKGKKKKMADENAKPSAGQKTLSFFACNEKKKVSDKLAGFTFSKQTD